MKKESLIPYLIFVSVFTTITIFVVIIQKSYLNLIKPTQDLQGDVSIKNIDPNIDKSIIEQISKRESILETEVPENETALIESLNVISPTPTMASIATQSAQPNISPTPTLIP